MDRRQFIGWLGTLFLTAGLGACATTREQTRLLVKIRPRNQLEPASLTVRPGTTVTWYNMGQWPQTVTCDPSATKDQSLVLLPKGAQAWDSGVLYPGQYWSYTFQTPGAYRFFSRMQVVSSLVGTVTVLQR